MSSKTTNVTIGGGERTNAKGSKPSYEPPCVVPRGELARGSGLCTPGSGQAGPNCISGLDAENNCSFGTIVAP